MPLLAKPPVPSPAQRRVRWRELHGGSAPLALAESLARDPRLHIIVTAGARALERLAAELGFFGGSEVPVLALPDWEVLPYELSSPHADIVSARLRALSKLPRMRGGALVIAADTLLQRLPPRGYVEGRTFGLAAGDPLEIDPFRTRLIEAGYASVSQVSGPGEFAVRGSIVDVFPMGAAEPLRIDLFADQIEAIRRFDPETQRSLDAIERIELLPAREVPLDPQAVRDFRRRYRTRFEGDPMRSTVYRGVSEGYAPPGIEFHLPLFFDTVATLFDYLPKDAVIVHDAGATAEIDRAWRDIESRYEDRRHDIEWPVLPPRELYLDPQELAERAAPFPSIVLDPSGPDAASPGEGVFTFTSVPPRALEIDTHAQDPLAPLERFCSELAGRVLVAADSPGRREVLHEMLSARFPELEVVPDWRTFADGRQSLALTVAADVEGFELSRPPIALVSESQLFGPRARQERRRRRATSDPQAILRDLTDLAPGAPVVHEEYGVGRYVGLTPLEVGGEPGEFLVLEYQDHDRVYVPVHSLHLVSRYTGAAPESAPLHKLGTDQWAKARKRAAEQVRDVAAELLDLYARRKAHPGLALPRSERDYAAFASAFPFEETPDQVEAIAKVLEDLAKPEPMDRIVCGDVGFGKTEVAMRAAFVAVQAGKQVAVLVPTTLLAQQHLANFRDRFADWPVRIESLSRFHTGKESDAVIEGIERGTVDIVIATHRLLHANVRFKDLALLVIDEEHRFGVRDKERLKALRTDMHVLTLTATPIPRTLNMALGSLRDLSLIATPPEERLAIKTSVTEWHGPALREAALRELRRGGQIYFVHNEVRTIEKIAQQVRELVPEADVRIGHGQMRERDLEQLMVDFYHRRFNLLVCTTIIESGIDVPTANTIMIHRADRMGLAQLHQLRGRVGRSHHRAYAYLIVPPRKELGADAVKRLEAIESLEDLGAGFVLATHDLEIRGAGELLGEAQSGQMTEVGLALYLELLERAVSSLKAGREPALDQPLAAATEVELHLPAFLPESYVSDVHVRLVLYKRIASAPDTGVLDELTAELVDRFGPLPPAGQNLFGLARLKLRARELGVHRLDLGPQGGYVLLEREHRIDPGVVIRMIQREPEVFRLEGSFKLRVARALAEVPKRFEFARALLGRLGAGVSGGSAAPAAPAASGAPGVSAAPSASAARAAVAATPSAPTARTSPTAPGARTAPAAADASAARRGKRRLEGAGR